MDIIEKHEGKFIVNYKINSNCNSLSLGSRFTGIFSPSDPLGRAFLFVFFAPRASPFLSIPTRCTGSHFIFFLFLAVRRGKRSERKNEKEREIARNKRGTGGGNRTGSEHDRESGRMGERRGGMERKRVEDRQRRTSVPRSRRLRRRYL